MLLLQRKYTLSALIVTIAALFSLVLPLPAAIRIFLTAAYFGVLGAAAGKFLPPAVPQSWKIFFGTLGVAAAFITLGSGLYYAVRFDKVALALLLVVLAAIAAILPPPKMQTRLIPEEPHGTDEKRGAILIIAGPALAVLYGGLIRYVFGLLSFAATADSLRSPWDVVPRMYFFLFFLLAAGIIALALGGNRPAFTLPLIAGFALLLTGVAAATYSAGFGFDPFIHQATEKVIVEKGVIEPKPLYYIGQYVFIAGLSHLTGLDVQALDVWLTPAAAALIAICAYWSLQAAFSLRKEAALAASMAVFLWPMSSFIVTTPQSFANVFGIITAFLALPAAAGLFPRLWVLLLALATATIHPLTGIPMLLFSGLLLFLTSYERTRGPHEFGRKLVLAEITFMGSLALPALFVLNSWISDAGVTLNSELLRAPSVIFEELSGDPPILRRFMAAYDFAYAWKNSQTIVLFAAAMIGLWLLRKQTRLLALYSLGAVMFFMNYLLLKAFVRFPFLISYERSNYADRIFDLTFFLLMPIALYAIAAGFERIRAGTALVKLFSTALLAALITSSLYLAYPRRDKYETSHGWSTSASDVKAVRLIAADAGNKNYVALANQSVSAAAIRESGFSRYYASRDESRPGYFFFYPIPTGDELYEDFDAMNASGGARGAALRAMNLTGVSTVYYVINDYWWHAQKNIASAKRQADRWWSVDDKSWIFRYDRRGNE